jgi:hypothetical protein
MSCGAVDCVVASAKVITAPEEAASVRPEESMVAFPPIVCPLVKVPEPKSRELMFDAVEVS